MAYINVGKITEELNDLETFVETAVEDKVSKGHEVIEFQAPDPNNRYAWYRKYADGWIEQGWRQTWSGAWTTVTLPIPMADANYTCTAGGYRTDSSPYQQMTCFKNYATTTVDIWSSDDTTSNAAEVRVFVCGMYAR